MLAVILIVFAQFPWGSAVLVLERCGGLEGEWDLGWWVEVAASLSVSASCFATATVAPPHLVPTLLSVLIPGLRWVVLADPSGGAV